MIHQGDCLEVLRTLDDESVDVVATDPPYGISFMGHEWDQPGVEMPAVLEGVPSGQRRRSNPAPSGHDRDGLAMHAGRYDLSRSANHAFQAWCEAWARECLRVLKPGGHIAAFGSARTSHRLAAGIEDAGFEIRDSILWLFGTGFPKSLNVARAIDKQHGEQGDAERYVAPGGEQIETTLNNWGANGRRVQEGAYSASSDDAQRWEGWGTALKPAHEPIIVGRKPLAGATVAANVLAYGTGALNIDACRIATGDTLGGGDQRELGDKAHGEGWDRPWMHDPEAVEAHAAQVNANVAKAEQLGRWPSNVVLSHAEDCVLVGTREVRNDGGSVRDAGPRENAVFNPHNAPRGDWQAYGADGVEVVEAWECAEGCPVRALDAQAGDLGKSSGTYGGGSVGGVYGDYGVGDGSQVGYGDSGGPSRFFYCGKASRLERNAGLDDFEKKPILWSSGEQNPGSFHAEGTERAAKNYHPTVKPLDLMRWLVRLLTPPAGIVLDPFCGSGTTGCACALEGFEFVGIERDLDADGESLGYIAIAEARIAFWASKPVGIETEKVLRAELANPARRGQLSIL